MQIILIFLLIILIIILFYLFLMPEKSRNQIISQKNRKKSIKNFKTQKKTLKTDEELFINKEETISNTERKRRKLQTQQEDQEFIEQEKIVGVVKPQGYWTQRIFGERFGIILAMSRQNKTGFWTTLVELNRTDNKNNKTKTKGR